MLKTYLAVLASVAALLCAAPALASTTPIYVAYTADLASNPGTAAGDVAFANSASSATLGGPQIQFSWLPITLGLPLSCPYSAAPHIRCGCEVVE